MTTQFQSDTSVINLNNIILEELHTSIKNFMGATINLLNFCPNENENQKYKYTSLLRMGS